MMKKYLFMLVVLAIVGLVAPASADYYLAGSFNSWDPAGQLMNDDGGGMYSATVSGLTADSKYEFKVTDGTWGTTFPPANSWLYADGSGNVNVTFNTNVVSDGWLTDQYRIGVSTDLGTWTVVGGFFSAGYYDWENAGVGMQMASQGGGIYMLSLDLPVGTYDWKIVDTGTWDAISEGERSINAPNSSVTTTAGLEVVNFYVDALGGVVRTEVVPEPATMTLLGIGSLLLASVRRKK